MTPKISPVDLGYEASFAELPARIRLGNSSYYLVHGEAGYELLSTVCPHQGGEVANVGSCFKCPQHGWNFEHATGKGINNTARLSSFPVAVSEGHLFADVSVNSASFRTAPQQTRRPDRLTIQLHAHACLEISYKAFSLFTDPWLCGPAFLGSWIQFPPPVVDISALRPDAILITHEHPDHFHEPTLARFDRSTAIYVPDFPNRRLVDRLAAREFSNVHALPFGVTCEITENLKLTCFEPQSLWNDAIVLIEIEDFRLLNLNDAGLNRRIASLVAPVDALAAQFSTGASGYPLTWNHLTPAEKISIMERSCQGKLQMLKEAVELYRASHLLPFASFFTLWHPSHRDYVRTMRTNSLEDVARAFEGSEVHLVDLLPGDSWHVATGHISRRRPRQEHFYNVAQRLRYLEERFDVSVFNEHHPTTGDLTRAEVESYLLQLNETPAMALCEDLTVRVRVTSENYKDAEEIDISFQVEAGELRVLKHTPDAPNLVIEIQRGVLKHIITKDLSWDEAHIGYWCRFTRSPDVYQPGFWRLLQAPYYKNLVDAPAVDHRPISGETVIADLIETYGDVADRIMRRYGLYCAGCHHSTHDTLALGARQHGITKEQVNVLIKELNQLIHASR